MRRAAFLLGLLGSSLAASSVRADTRTSLVEITLRKLPGENQDAVATYATGVAVDFAALTRALATSKPEAPAQARSSQTVPVFDLLPGTQCPPLTGARVGPAW